MVKEANVEAKTNNLLSSHLAQDFHTFGHAHGDDEEGHWLCTKNAEKDIKELFDCNALTTVADVYGLSSGKLDASARPYQGTPGRTQNVSFNVGSHPDDGAKGIMKVGIHRLHIATPNMLHYACKVTHTEFTQYSGGPLETWFSNQQKYYERQTLGIANARVRRVVERNGGYEEWLQAGRHNRIQAFYAIFDAAPACSTTTMFPVASDVYDIENVNGKGPDNEVAKACRSFDRYKFAEIMEDAFFACRALHEKGAKDLQRCLFKSMVGASNPTIETLRLPDDWRKLPGKCVTDDGKKWSGYPKQVSPKRAAGVKRPRTVLDIARGR